MDNSIKWVVPAFEGNFTNPKFATDRANILSALGRVQAFDAALSTPDERATVTRQLPQPQTPDDLTESMETRAQAICNAGQAPISFRGIYRYRDPSPSEGSTELFIQTPGGEYPFYSSVGIFWPSRIDALNRVAPPNRAAVKFRFEVVFGNQNQGLNWTEAQWMETILHEIGIRKRFSPYVALVLG